MSSSRKALATLLLAAVILLLIGLWSIHRLQQPAAPRFNPALGQGAVYVPPSREAAPAAGASTALPAFLPAEARDTIALIQHAGPFTHRQDGSVFGNREGRLPRRPRGWYHEYTVETPGSRDRGARRIVTGVVIWWRKQRARQFASQRVERGLAERG